MHEALVYQAEDVLEEALDRFRCYKDTDIEQFLRNKAIEFEKRGFCTVYLLVDRELFLQGHISIQAYFTLSHKFIEFNPDVSRNVRGKVASHRDADFAHFVLIGQLGKYMRFDKLKGEYVTEVNSVDILNDAFDVIRQASDIIVCRGILVECSPEESVHNVYKKYGFTFLQYDDGHYQFYKRVPNNA